MTKRLLKKRGRKMVEIKLTQGDNKYIVIANQNGIEAIISKDLPMHADIYNSVQSKYFGSYPKGGGRIRFNQETKVIEVYGSSGSYGTANHEEIKSILSTTYAEYTIKGDEDIEKEKETERRKEEKKEKEDNIIKENKLLKAREKSEDLSEIVDSYLNQGNLHKAYQIISGEDVDPYEGFKDYWKDSEERKIIDVELYRKKKDMYELIMATDIGEIEGEENLLAAINIIEGVKSSYDLYDKQEKIREHRDSYFQKAWLTKTIFRTIKDKQTVEKLSSLYLRLGDKEKAEEVSYTGRILERKRSLNKTCLDIYNKGNPWATTWTKEEGQVYREDPWDYSSSSLPWGYR